MSLMFIVESCARTHHILIARKEHFQKENQTFEDQPIRIDLSSGSEREKSHKNINTTISEDDENIILLEMSQSSDEIPVKHVDENKKYMPAQPIIFKKKYEYNELIKIYMGKKWKTAFTVILTIYLFGAIWSYVAVFGTSLTSFAPIPSITHGDKCEVDIEFTQNCNNNYLLYIVLFGIVIIPISCADLVEQKWLQIFLFGFRFVALILMILTCFVAMFNSHDSQHMSSSKPYIAEPYYFNWKHLPLAFASFIFSQTFHHSALIITEPLRKKNKLRTIFTSSLLTTYGFFSFLGIICSLYFGKKVKSILTLNWIEYSAAYDHPPFWAVTIRIIIIIFPILDVVSVFPLKVVTIGTALQNLFVPRTLKSQDKTSKMYKILFRVMAGLFPLIGAMIMKKIPIIILFNGIIACLITFIFPTILQYKSQKEAQKWFGFHKTKYSNFTSGKAGIYIIGTFGSIVFLYSAVYSIYDYFFE
ncbi:hypothetical protein M0813_03319 [Anaeramoeba flamelloides]|uniref:Amino acid transporter transmembrane domain-containing protein n=1 Tax=Anaeramoeba flamelloides TaxID=1746091 RepID=A0ABQ8Y0M4_9EUKA|nr:hypothetical protein M0813_03319 [Anaeramoeba flamelloides]